jgi:hypothetical protein
MQGPPFTQMGTTSGPDYGVAFAGLGASDTCRDLPLHRWGPHLDRTVPAYRRLGATDKRAGKSAWRLEAGNGRLSLGYLLVRIGALDYEVEERGSRCEKCEDECGEYGPWIFRCLLAASVVSRLLSAKRCGVCEGRNSELDRWIRRETESGLMGTCFSPLTQAFWINQKKNTSD